MYPYGRQLIDEADIDAVVKVLKSDLLTSGPLVEKFENKLCELVDSSYAIACSNGTTALHLALLALGIGKGDKVLVPAITFLASANAALYVGAEVIFVDVDPLTGLITAETLKEALNKYPNDSSVKAVINVHFAGQCGNLEALSTLARAHNLYIIEDAAHALGTLYQDKDGVSHAIGANHFSDITVFSFHPVKTIAMGEGGAITTNDVEYSKKLKLLRSHGMVRKPSEWLIKEQGFDEKNQPNPWYYEMQVLGYNYRISDINCALGLSQLEKLFVFKKTRTQIVSAYDAYFLHQEYFKPLKKYSFSDTAWHLYIILLDFNKVTKTKAQIMRDLQHVGIGSQVHYIPLYRQPYYKAFCKETNLLGSEKYYQECLSLPLYASLDEQMVQDIANAVLSCVQ